MKHHKEEGYAAISRYVFQMIRIQCSELVRSPESRGSLTYEGLVHSVQ